MTSGSKALWWARCVGSALVVLLIVALAAIALRFVPYFLLVAASSGLFIFTCYRERCRHPRFPPGCCRRCGYDLTGNVSGVCPECGVPI